MAKSARKEEPVASDNGAATDTTEATTPSGDVAVAEGIFRLAPIEGSVDRRTLEVDIDLTSNDGTLRLGDLRRAGERATSAEHHEAAHRIWTVLIEAARRVGNVPLEALSVSRADGARLESKRAGRGNVPTPAPSNSYAYDYEALAADRADGATQSEVAREWGCSPGTVARAVRYVARRDELLDERPELLDDLATDATIAELAERYDTPNKIMRWIVTSSLDRRSA